MGRTEVNEVLSRLPLAADSGTDTSPPKIRRTKRRRAMRRTTGKVGRMKKALKKASRLG